MKVNFIKILLKFTFFVTITTGPLLSFCQSWPTVPDIDLGTLKPSDFKDDEVDLPYYLKHFHTIANSVVETGPNRGFINIAVWRTVPENMPVNTRIMENIISLAYFYCTNRPWNIYYGNSAVRVRLEAALNFWCNKQNNDGSFLEGKGPWVIASTAFATKFMSESLVFLKSGPPIDKELLQRVIKADKKAITYILTDPKMYQDGRSFTNQFTCAYAGATTYMSIYPDAEMHQQLLESLKKSSPDFQSPAGFFYEEAGIDFGYNFDTHHSNLWICYSNTRTSDPELAKFFIDEEKRYYEWLKYNVVPEPGLKYFTVNRGIEMRQKTPVLFGHLLEAPLGEVVPGMAAFNDDLDEKAKKIADKRRSLISRWPNVPALAVNTFGGYSPYTFLHRGFYHWNPTPAEKKAAVAALPYNASNNFIDQKMDSRRPWVLTYISKPKYYAAFNAGPLGQQKLKMQRFGLGLLWNSVAGAILQSQSNTDDAAWGTKAVNDSLVYEAGPLKADFKVDDKNITPMIGNHDLTPGTFSATYQLANNGNKTVTFKEDGVYVDVHHNNGFKEQIPFLLNAKDKLNIVSKGKAELKKNGITITVQFDANSKANIVETDHMSGTQKVFVLNIESANHLNYAITIEKNK